MGRSTDHDGNGKLSFSGDPTLSRAHFTVRLVDGRAEVEKSPEASNPLFYLGEQRDRFSLEPGGHFLAGRTEFQFLVYDSLESPPAAREYTLAPDQRQPLRDRQARECLHALARLYPALRQAVDQPSLWKASLEVLQGLLPSATAVEILEVDREALARDERSFYRVVESQELLPAGAPSRRLVRQAFEEGSTVLHIWEAREPAPDATVAVEVTWALVSPLMAPGRTNFALYTVGADLGAASARASTERLPGQNERVLLDLIAEALNHHLLSAHSQQLQAQVGQFFSPAVRHLLLDEGAHQVLTPSRREVTVLFFDLRGFSRATEAALQDEREERAIRYHELMVDVMTRVTSCVFEEDGVVVDYQGDAVMACWGAPVPREDHAHRGVRAAGAIARVVHGMDLPFQAERAGRQLRCGIGLATGRVVAGQVGGREQVKFGVMGTVVNQASRIEGLTRTFGVPVLVTDEIRRMVGSREPFRRVGRVRPAGMREPVELHELVVPADCGGSGLTAEEVEAYETAETHFREGDMLQALQWLRRVPLEDPVGSFLSRLAHDLRHHGVPPGWDGVIGFDKK